MRRCIAILGFGLLVLILAIDQAATRADDSNVVDRFKVDNASDGLYVPVNVRGKDYLFLLDTGACHKLLSGDSKSSVAIDGVVGDCSLSLFDIPPATLGKHNLQEELSKPWSDGATSLMAKPSDPRNDIGVLGSDLSELREASGREFYGIIGMDFLHKWVLQINCDQGEVLLLRKATRDKAVDKIKLSYNAGCPLVRCRVPDWGETDFELDTGCNDSGCLESRLAKYLVEGNYIRAVGVIGSSSVSGKHSEKIFRVPTFILDKHQTQNLLLSEAKDNLLGIGYLSRYEVTFDFPNNLLYVREGKTFGKCDETNLSGLHLVRKDDKTIVQSVDPESAAETAGLKVDDVILNVDNLDANKSSLSDLRPPFCQENATVHVIAMRENKTFDANVEIK